LARREDRGGIVGCAAVFAIVVVEPTHFFQNNLKINYGVIRYGCSECDWELVDCAVITHLATINEVTNLQFHHDGLCSLSRVGYFDNLAL
jgi:hypothetical protein